MPNPSYTYTLTNGNTADASQVTQNFTDILNGVTDGTKDLSINALTVAGTASLNGNINLGNASSDVLTITATPTAFPLTGIVDGSSAAVGKVGEILTQTASGVSITDRTSGGDNVVSLSLTAGDWIVWGTVAHARSSGGTRTVSWTYMGINTTSATLPSNSWDTFAFDASITGDAMRFPAPMRNINVSVTTIVYLVLQCHFSGTTTSADGVIYARRIR